MGSLEPLFLQEGQTTSGRLERCLSESTSPLLSTERRKSLRPELWKWSEPVRRVLAVFPLDSSRRLEEIHLPSLKPGSPKQPATRTPLLIMSPASSKSSATPSRSTSRSSLPFEGDSCFSYTRTQRQS